MRTSAFLSLLVLSFQWLHEIIAKKCSSQRSQKAPQLISLYSRNSSPWSVIYLGFFFNDCFENVAMNIRDQDTFSYQDDTSDIFASHHESESVLFIRERIYASKEAFSFQTVNS